MPFLFFTCYFKMTYEINRSFTYVPKFTIIRLNELIENLFSKLHFTSNQCNHTAFKQRGLQMNYRVAKVFNSNAVLAQDETETQVVLMSKGIGFGRHIGELIEDYGDNQKIFYILDDNVNAVKMKQLDFEVKKVEQVTREIVEVARERLQIDNDKLYGALVDHITFAVECLHMGLPIDNPFCGEIAILYSQEYETAQIAAEIIKERIGVEIGDGETGFIALHLYSARKNKHIRTAMCIILCDFIPVISDISTHFKVFLYGHFRKNSSAFRNLCQTEFNNFVCLCGTQVLTAKGNLPALRLYKAGDRMERCGFSCSVCTDQRYNFAFLHLK